MDAMAAILDFLSERFQLFCIFKLPQYFLSSFKLIGLSIQEKQHKNDFQDGRHGCHLGFPIRMILAIFDLQVAQILPTKFRVNWCRRSRLLKKIAEVP